LSHTSGNPLFILRLWSILKRIYYQMQQVGKDILLSYPNSKLPTIFMKG